MLPHLPIEIFKDLMLKGTIFLPNFSEQNVAATFASLRPGNLKLYTFANIIYFIVDNMSSIND